MFNIFNIIYRINILKGVICMEEKIKSKKVMVKGYMRPDGTSYYVTVPKDIRDFLDLKGGEYFLMRGKIKGEKKKISMKIVDFDVEEE